MNIFMLTGPEFLKVAILLQIAAYPAALLVRNLIETQNQKARIGDDIVADSHTAAYLNGGVEHLFITMLKVMEKKQIVEINSYDKTVKLATSANPPQNDYESRIFYAIGPETKQIQTVFQLLKFELEKSQSFLVKAGLVPSDFQKDVAQILAIFVYCAPIFTLELPRLFSGIANHKPILFLLFLIITAFIGLYSLKRDRFARTRYGDTVLKTWRAQNKSLKDNFKSFGSSLRLKDVELALALFAPVSIELLKPQPVFSNAFNNDVSDYAYGCGAGEGGASCGGSCGGGCGGGCGG